VAVDKKMPMISMIPRKKVINIEKIMQGHIMFLLLLLSSYNRRDGGRARRMDAGKKRFPSRTLDGVQRTPDVYGG
jgi:hypothetical protein